MCNRCVCVCEFVRVLCVCVCLVCEYVALVRANNPETLCAPPELPCVGIAQGALGRLQLSQVCMCVCNYHVCLMNCIVMINFYHHSIHLCTCLWCV